MKRFLLVCGFGAAAVGHAWASGYSDFDAGVSAHNREDEPESIRLFSLALNASDLPSQLRPIAYFDRASAYLWSRQDDLALSDLNACLALSPALVPALTARGELLLMRKEYDKAQSDFQAVETARPDLIDGPRELVQLNIERKNFDAALTLSNDAIGKWPHQALPYLMRAKTYWAMGKQTEAMSDYDSAVRKDSLSIDALAARAKAYRTQGKLDDALSDFEDAAKRMPSGTGLRYQIGFLEWDLGQFSNSERTFAMATARGDNWPYAFLWLYLSGVRINVNGQVKLSDDASKVDPGKWPAPLIKLYGGTGNPDGVMKAAATAGPADAPEQSCEANFYVGEWRLLHGDQSRAKAMLTEAAQKCGIDDIESTAAAAELKRLAQSH